MKQKKWPVRLISGGLMTLALVGVAVAAGQQGSKTDPLVTLSYLNDQALPAILEQVHDKVADNQTGLEENLDAVLDRYVETARAVCAERGVPLADAYAKWKAIAAAGVDVTELLANQMNHPTREMNWLFAVTLLETILTAP